MRKINISLFALVLGMTGSAFAADIEALSAECESCHGPVGVSSNSDVPTIAGQTSDFIADTLRSFQIWARPCVKSKYRHGDTSRPRTDMCQIAEGLSDEDIDAISGYYGSKPFVSAGQEFDAGLAAAGAGLHAEHCENCHAGGGSVAGVGPRIAGQWIPYLKSSLKFVPTGEHQVPSMMERHLGKISEEELDALMNFYASQQE